MSLLRIKRPGRLLTAAIATAALLVVAGLPGGTRPAAALSNCTVSDNTFDAEEKEFLRLINNYRAANGKPALTASVNLNRASSWMARDMAVNKYFSHTDSSGRSASTRVVNCDGLPSVGENIAAGTIKDTAAEAFEMWRNSSGHNANMLNGSYKQIGIARYYDAASPYSWYWVTDFSTSTDGTNASSGSTGGTSPTATPTRTASATSTPSPTATPAPATSAKALISSPGNNATLLTSQKFSWALVNNATAYRFYMGTSKGSSNMVNLTMSNRTTALTVSGLPRTGQTVYVRLWTNTPSGWQYNDYTYQLPR